MKVYGKREWEKHTRIFFKTFARSRFQSNIQSAEDQINKNKREWMNEWMKSHTHTHIQKKRRAERNHSFSRCEIDTNNWIKRQQQSMLWMWLVSIWTTMEKQLILLQLTSAFFIINLALAAILIVRLIWWKCNCYGCWWWCISICWLRLHIIFNWLICIYFQISRQRSS